MRTRLRIRVLLVLLGALAAPALGVAQEPAEGQGAATAAPHPPPPPPVIRVPEVAAHAARVSARLRELDLRLIPSPASMKIELAFHPAAREMELGERRVKRVLQRSVDLEFLNELERDWGKRRQRFATWSTSLTDEAGELEKRLEGLVALRELWERSEGTAREAEAPEPVLERIRSTQASIAVARKRLAARRIQLLTIQNWVSELSARAAAVEADVASARAQARSRLFERESEPLWVIAVRLGEPVVDAEGERESLLAHLPAGVEFLRERRDQLVIQGLLLALLIPALLALRMRAREWVASGDEDLGRAAVIFERPISSALLFAILISTVLHPPPPAAIQQAIGFLLLIPTLRLLFGLVERTLHPWVWALAAFYLMDVVRSVLDPFPLIERAVFVLELLATLGVLGWFLRPGRLAQLPRDVHNLRMIGWIARLAFGALLLALLANLLGFVRLSILVGQSLLWSAYFGVVLYAGVHVLDGLVAGLLRTPLVLRSHAVRGARPVIRRRIRRAARVAATALWLFLALNALSVADLAWAGATGVLVATLTIGTLNLSLADVAVFGLTIWAAFLVADFVRFVLEEDIYPRVQLSRGPSHALTSALRYGLLMIGFLFALAAAGVDFSRMTLLLGAFGVGIGFGLQSVVNNVVSGFILLAERPVQVGDTVAVGELFGDVRRIGIRSSTIRTWDGSEVIVPNSQLISEQVVNWTLSDRLRRIDVPVGVAYGTDPQRVLALLVEVARAHPRVLESPEPRPLFKGFGDSSLDFELRAWTGHFQEFVVTHSDLVTGIHDALVDAGISIPFPQRDLHLKTVPERS